MDLEGCWVSRFHFLELGSWILRAAGCQGFIFLGGGIMDFQGVQVSILEVGSCMPYILFILVIYIICIMYIHNMLFHMVPFSASAFKVPFGFCYCHKICTKKRKKTSIKQTVHMRFLFSCHVFTVCIRTENQNQAVGSYSLFFAWL